MTQQRQKTARGLLKRKMAAAASEVAELAQRVALAAGDPGHMLAVSPDELLARLVRYMDEVVQVCSDSVAEARRDADALSSRHAALRRRLRQLYGGYRALRYKLHDEWPGSAGSGPPRVAHEDAVLGGTLEDIIRALRYKLHDEWPGGAGSGPPRVAHEDAVLGGTLEDIIRADDESDRQALQRQQNKVAALEATLAGLKVRQLEWDTLGAAGAGKLGKQGPAADGGASASLQLENSRLRQEIDRLKARLPALGLMQQQQQQQQQQQLRRTGSDVGQPGVDVLREQIAQSCESRAVMAEEQLAHLQRYMATASVTYQREIMRLRAALQQADPAALWAMGPAAAAGGQQGT
ncbi:hypothetical protein OEZ85_006106 [Tetradesmus obliquus]|uniref:NAB domain-containing protein n=1 Tax=Tetradesmus obliquus TaxID=3088 RepID=A0ABY8UHY2_TETOB|nr:hypothetical protein OEZ85_006106 [Tetradesmus obliquus]